ncbi:protein PTST homolog 3, chloroplastic isoform X2 [Hevea brasiliensis]|uniref:protein PTST homolog 3, chloroplastic isoform X2 n=1 Tax=Hevea brasiliensis TaxID=3981 RepID=UPI0025E7C6FF|nr:protein PTST homolog 3, chloroplastic isoform X2 [Hevea brasiliensis]
MPTLSQSPCFLSFSSHKFFLIQGGCKISWNTRYHPPQKNFRFCVCSAKKSRGGRKVKSNIELCNDIREFISAVGLPEGHVPSMKELSDHGRTDLAHIVRRRGYKVIRDLLSNSMEEEIDGSNIEKTLPKEQDTISDHTDILTGQDEKVEDIIEDSSLPTEVPIIYYHSDSAGSNPECNSSDHSSKHTESLVRVSLDIEWQNDEDKSMVKDINSSTPLSNIEQQLGEVQNVVQQRSSATPFGNVEQQDQEALSVVEDNSLSTEVLIMDNSHGSLNGYLDPNSDINTFVPMESSVNSSLGEKGLDNSKGQQEKVNRMAEDIVLPTGVLNLKRPADSPVSSLNFGDHSSMPGDPAAMSLEDKVAKFIQSGDLDVIEDTFYGILDESTKYSEGVNEPENETEIPSKTPSEEKSEHAVSRSNAALALNGNIPTSKHNLPPVRIYHPARNDSLSDEGPASSDLDKDYDVETNKREDQIEINHLKLMLVMRQKELELSRLKEQIEKEKLALSDLQTKAEREISKAQKLISEKDVELLAAEESLSGLVEVKIQYTGDGEIVEVAGSFSGWHHPIKMDPQPSSSNSDTTGSRKSRFWSTMLWLYPGVYEIKFIVDGHWKIDPQIETVTKGGICNNILQVVG